MSEPFKIKYNWNDFDNTSTLTSFQKYRIKTRCEKAIEDTIQKVINESHKDRSDRREELNAHKNPDDPFMLDIGGEG